MAAGCDSLREHTEVPIAVPWSDHRTGTSTPKQRKFYLFVFISTKITTVAGRTIQLFFLYMYYFSVFNISILRLNTTNFIDIFVKFHSQVSNPSLAEKGKNWNEIIIESHKMINKLNDDCQLRIINYLDLPDQLALWIATKNFSRRLNDNVSWVWQKQKKFPLSWILCRLEDNPEMLDAFLSTIGGTMQSLKLYSLTLEDLKFLKNYNFPNVCDLTCEAENDFDYIELEMDLLAEIFPGLISLTLRNISLGSIAIHNLKQLRKLKLCEIYDLNGAEFLSLGSESLEELTIGYWVVSFVHYTLLNDFPKLRTLALTKNDDPGDLDAILTKRGNDITELSFCHSFYVASRTILQSCLKNLIRLTLIYEQCTCIEDLQSVVSGMPLLEQLDLVYFQSPLTEIQLWKIVVACPSLKILYISGMHWDKDFIEPSRHYMKQALENRSVPLRLHCHNIGANRHLVSTTELTD